MNQIRREGERKILFCMPQIIMGGVEKVLLTYMGQLQASGRYDCGVVCLTPVTDSFFLDFFIKHHFPLHIVRTSSIRKERKGFWARRMQEYRNFSLWYSARRVMTVLAAQYDIIIDFHNLSFGAYLHYFSQSQKKIGFYHGSICNFASGLKKKQKYLQSYDRIVCLSQAFELGFRKLHPTWADKICCIYNPIEAGEIQRLSTGDYPSYLKPYFVAVQRLDAREKDVPTVIRGFRLFHKLHTEYKLVIVGDGPYRRELEESAAPEIAEGNIIFTGQLNNPYPVIRQAEALILSSTKLHGEGLGQVLVEAQALNVPAVSSDVPSGPAEVLMDGEAGYLFEPENPEALAQTLEQLVNAPDERAEKVRRASEGLKRFDPKECISHFMELIN